MNCHADPVAGLFIPNRANTRRRVGGYKAGKEFMEAVSETIRSVRSGSRWLDVTRACNTGPQDEVSHEDADSKELSRAGSVERTCQLGKHRPPPANRLTNKRPGGFRTDWMPARRDDLKWKAEKSNRGGQSAGYSGKPRRFRLHGTKKSRREEHVPGNSPLVIERYLARDSSKFETDSHTAWACFAAKSIHNPDRSGLYDRLRTFLQKKQLTQEEEDVYRRAYYAFIQDFSDFHPGTTRVARLVLRCLPAALNDLEKES